MILESVPELRAQHQNFFLAFEAFSVVIFTIEYLLRLWVADNRWQFVKSPMAVIDLLAILPSLLPYVHVDLRFLRSFRLFRLLRIFKLASYSHALQLLGRVFMSRRHELAVSVLLGLFLLTMSASCVYFFENEAQPDKFTSIPHSMWWAAATLTTVGYGDVYPITVMGRLFGALTAFLGVGMFALPAGILASAFAEEMKRNPGEVQKCPHCGKEI